MKRFIYAFVYAFILAGSMSCWIFGDRIDCGNGYAYGTNGSTSSWLTKEKYISEKDTTVILGITSHLRGFDFNDEFIVASQVRTDSLNRDYNAFWIIEKQTDVVHGPMSKDSFELLRKELDVPAELKVQSPYEW